MGVLGVLCGMHGGHVGYGFTIFWECVEGVLGMIGGGELSGHVASTVGDGNEVHMPQKFTCPKSF